MRGNFIRENGEISWFSVLVLDAPPFGGSRGGMGIGDRAWGQR
jgi:hypothetical protein